MWSLEFLNCEVREEKAGESQENTNYKASSQGNLWQFSPDKALQEPMYQAKLRVNPPKRWGSWGILHQLLSLAESCSWGLSFPGTFTGNLGFYGQRRDRHCKLEISFAGTNMVRPRGIWVWLWQFGSICWQHSLSRKWLGSLKYSFQLWYPALCRRPTAYSQQSFQQHQ